MRIETVSWKLSINSSCFSIWDPLSGPFGALACKFKRSWVQSVVAVTRRLGGLAPRCWNVCRTSYLLGAQTEFGIGGDRNAGHNFLTYRSMNHNTAPPGVISHWSLLLSMPRTSPITTCSARACPGTGHISVHEHRDRPHATFRPS